MSVTYMSTQQRDLIDPSASTTAYFLGAVQRTEKYENIYTWDKHEKITVPFLLNKASSKIGSMYMLMQAASGFKKTGGLLLPKSIAIVKMYYIVVTVLLALMC